MEKIKSLYYKHREAIHYLFIGGCTTLLSWALMFLFYEKLHWNSELSNALSIIGGVAFAYVTNRAFVFFSHSKGLAFWKELLIFVASRAFTMALEFFGVMGLERGLRKDAMVAKMIITVAVVILNYVLSKLFVFRKTQK